MNNITSGLSFQNGFLFIFLYFFLYKSHGKLWLFMKFTNQSFPSVYIFAFRKTTKLLLTLESHHIFAYLKLEANKPKSRQSFPKESWLKSCKSFFKLSVKVVRATICLYFIRKRVKLHTIFLHLDNILVKPPMSEYTALPHNHFLLEIVTKFWSKLELINITIIITIFTIISIIIIITIAITISLPSLT